MNTGNSIPKKNGQEQEKGFGIGACAFVCKVQAMNDTRHAVSLCYFFGK
jgi:hypothetical protein